MNIDIILTGGTIGTVVKKNQAALDNSLIFQELLKGSRHNFKIHNPFTIHSENLIPDHWQALYREINSIEDTDGIIITHGTDTLVYTAAFLSLAYAKRNVPIILVSSSQPMHHPQSNAKDNFHMALKAIEKGVKGVFVSYRNEGAPATLYLANKLLGFAPYSHRLLSAEKEPYAAIKDGEFIRFGGDFLENNPPKIKFPVNRVVFIPALPGADYGFYLNCKNQPDCYLAELYHSTTCCVNEKENKYNLGYFIDRCNDMGIKVYIAPYENREFFYPSRMKLPKAVPLTQDTVAMAYVRLLFKDLKQ